MIIKILKSKVTLTVTEVKDEGLTLDPALIQALNVVAYEQCEVNGKTTYIIPGAAGNVIVGSDLGANKGEKITINIYGYIDDWLRRRNDVKDPNKKNEFLSIVTVDEQNKVKKIDLL